MDWKAESVECDQLSLAHVTKNIHKEKTKTSWDLWRQSKWNQNNNGGKDLWNWCVTSGVKGRVSERWWERRWWLWWGDAVTPIPLHICQSQHTLPSDVILRLFQPILSPSGPWIVPWFSSETLALYKSPTHLLTAPFHLSSTINNSTNRHIVQTVVTLRQHSTVSQWHCEYSDYSHHSVTRHHTQSCLRRRKRRRQPRWCPADPRRSTPRLDCHYQSSSSNPDLFDQTGSELTTTTDYIRCQRPTQ